MTEVLERVRSRIEALNMNFQFIKVIKTKMNGIEQETWLLEYEGDQFVFVPGQKNVVLGWDTKQPLSKKLLQGLQKEFALGHEYYQGTLEELREDYQEEIQKAAIAGDVAKAEKLSLELVEDEKNYKEEMENGYLSWDNFLEKWNAHLSECFSPLRRADIGDMIVEVDSRYLECDMPSLEEAVCSLKEGPFTLATEDEWEYLCNGGTRTFFRWGDILNDTILNEIYDVGTVNNEKETASSVVNQSNMFGLFIAYNSYKNEIIDNILYTKGGDGGCSLCGGDGPIYVLPCYSAFYRDLNGNYDYGDYGLSQDYYCYRRIIRLT